MCGPKSRFWRGADSDPKENCSGIEAGENASRCSKKIRRFTAGTCRSDRRFVSERAGDNRSDRPRVGGWGSLIAARKRASYREFGNFLHAEPLARPLDDGDQIFFWAGTSAGKMKVK